MKKSKEQYLTDKQIAIVMERVDSNESHNLLDVFEVTTETPNSLCGNVRVSFNKNKAILTDYSTYKDSYISSYKQISSALACYRAISLFKCGTMPETQDFYKCNWSVLLKHKKTGQHLMLGEWKGGFQIFTEAHSLKGLKKQFIKDAEAFLTFFVSTKCTIGYDGVVAGSVA